MVPQMLQQPRVHARAVRRLISLALSPSPFLPRSRSLLSSFPSRSLLSPFSPLLPLLRLCDLAARLLGGQRAWRVQCAPRRLCPLRTRTLKRSWYVSTLSSCSMWPEREREREGGRGRGRPGGRGAGRREEKRREVNGERERRGGESVVWRSEGARERILQ